MEAVEHVIAPSWLWDEALNGRRRGPRFRVTRIPVGEGAMREEMVQERNLGACVADLSVGDDVYVVLVQRAPEEEP